MAKEFLKTFLAFVDQHVRCQKCQSTQNVCDNDEEEDDDSDNDDDNDGDGDGDDDGDDDNDDDDDDGDGDGDDDGDDDNDDDYAGGGDGSVAVQCQVGRATMNNHLIVLHVTCTGVASDAIRVA